MEGWREGGRKETQGETPGGSSSALPDYFGNEKTEAKPFEQNAENYPSFPNFFPSSSIIQNCLAFLKCLV